MSAPRRWGMLRAMERRLIAVLSLVALLVGCGDDDGTTDAGPVDMATPTVDEGVADQGVGGDDLGTPDFGPVRQTFLGEAYGIWLDGCDCSSNEEACVDAGEKSTFYVRSKGDCVLPVFEDPSAADYVACYRATVADLKTCLDAVEGCDTDAVDACYDAWNPAIEACPSPSTEVWDAIDACLS